MNVMVIWMFDLRPFTHAVIGGTISLFIGLVIYMVAVLDAPFKGSNGIRPDAAGRDPFSKPACTVSEGAAAPSRCGLYQQTLATCQRGPYAVITLTFR